VLGHSWGTILALEYYRAHPDRVASLTFGSPVFDVPAYERRARQLVSTLSDSAQRAIRTAETASRYDSPAYQNAINEFYALYVFRHPVQADLDSTFASFNQGIYSYMQGPSEFTITGTLSSMTPSHSCRGLPVPAW
jgi:proline iminopeptidase